MNNSGLHVVFYDGTCGLCDHAVQFILNQDKKQLFVFAPLQGITANKLLQHIPSHMKSVDSLILIENYQSEKRRYFIRSKAVCSICWLLGGPWYFVGWMSFLPAAFLDWVYRLIASQRHLFFTSSCLLPHKAYMHRFFP